MSKKKKNSLASPKDPLGYLYMNETDVSLHQRGHPKAFWISLCVLAFFISFYIWADVTMLDDVVRGSGKVTPASGLRDVQSDQGGTISDLLVKEGDHVEPNQVVAVIANIQDVSALRELQQRGTELKLSLIRLKAEAEGSELRYTPSQERDYPEIVQNQRLIYNTTKQRSEGEDKQLSSQIEQKKREIEIALEERRRSESALELLRKEEAEVRPLVGRSYSQISYLALLERITSLEGALSSIEHTFAQAEVATKAAEERLQTRKAERLAAIAVERNQNRIEMETIETRIQTWTEQVSRAELRAPVAGTVKTIRLKEGAVARPAEIIMDIISDDDSLEIEARFSPADRGFLYLSQTGMAKFSSYDFSIYGGLQASVVRISDDTIPDKRGQPWYEVRLVTSKKSISYRGKELPILPGMTVSLDLLTNKRSVLDRLLAPILSAQKTALTEH